MVAITHVWLEMDESAAARWLDHHEDGASRDAAVSQYVFRLVQKDPEAAFRWSESVQNEKERHQLMGSAILSWLRTEPQKARAALQASDFPEEQKRSLLQMNPQ